MINKKLIIFFHDIYGEKLFYIIIFPQDLQGEVRAKELEIDAVTEKAQQLNKTLVTGRSSVVTELGHSYHQVSFKVKVSLNLIFIYF